MTVLTALALVAALAGQVPSGQAPAGQAQAQEDGPIMTSRQSGESAEALRTREAIAYSATLPPDAPRQDYPLVAWCEALVMGHVTLGESLNSTDPLDLEIIRLGRLEASDFRSALTAAEARQTPAQRQEARTAAAAAAAKWTPLMAEETALRSQTFGLFYGLPVRCEHAARRIRNDISTPPATLKDVGLEADAPASN